MVATSYGSFANGNTSSKMNDEDKDKKKKKKKKKNAYRDEALKRRLNGSY